jgi:hypothetical protein
MDALILTETHKWLGISLESWLTIAAIVAGPILALYFQRLLDAIREKHNRQLRVFRELMITRSMRLSARHVEALNAVPLEFENKGKDKKILAAWKQYLDHLNTDSTKDPMTWSNKGAELIVELLLEMATRVRFQTEKPRIEREIYLPQLFNTIETEQNALRQWLLELLDGTGRRKLPIAMFEQRFPDVTPPAKPRAPESK